MNETPALNQWLHSVEAEARNRKYPNLFMAVSDPSHQWGHQKEAESLTERKEKLLRKNQASLPEVLKDPKMRALHEYNLRTQFFLENNQEPTPYSIIAQPPSVTYRKTRHDNYTPEGLHRVQQTRVPTHPNLRSLTEDYLFDEGDPVKRYKPPSDPIKAEFERLNLENEILLYPKGRIIHRVLSQVRDKLPGKVDINPHWNRMMGIEEEGVGSSKRITNLPKNLAYLSINEAKRLSEAKSLSASEDAIKAEADSLRFLKKYFKDRETPGTDRGALGADKLISEGVGSLKKRVEGHKRKYFQGALTGLGDEKNPNYNYTPEGLRRVSKARVPIHPNLRSIANDYISDERDPIKRYKPPSDPIKAEFERLNLENESMLYPKRSAVHRVLSKMRGKLPGKVEINPHWNRMMGIEEEGVGSSKRITSLPKNLSNLNSKEVKHLFASENAIKAEADSLKFLKKYFKDRETPYTDRETLGADKLISEGVGSLKKRVEGHKKKYFQDLGQVLTGLGDEKNPLQKARAALTGSSDNSDNFNTAVGVGAAGLGTAGTGAALLHKMRKAREARKVSPSVLGKLRNLKVR